MKLSPGIRYMLIASFFFALMNLGVKYLPNVPAVEIVFFRSIISLVLSFAVLGSKRVPLFGNNRRLLFLRGLTGAIALILYFITLQSIPLASAVTIQFLAPIFTTVLGIFIVKERVARVQWLFFAIAFCGVLVIKNVDTRITTEFLVIGIIATIFMGLAYNIIRKLNTSEHPLVIVAYFPLVTLPFTGVYSAFNWVQPQGWEWLILLSVGIFTQIAQFFMTKAYQLEEISKVASMKYVGIIYALIFGYILFGEQFTIYSYLGMLLVLVGVMLNIAYKQEWLKTKAGQQWIQQTFKMLRK